MPLWVGGEERQVNLHPQADLPGQVLVTLGGTPGAIRLRLYDDSYLEHGQALTNPPPQSTYAEALLPGPASVNIAFRHETTNTPNYSCSFSLPVMAYGVDIAVRKQGTAAAPESGLIVHKSEFVEFALAPGYFYTVKMLENQVTWQYCQMKNDGTYTGWVSFANGTGTRFATVMPDGGIYKIRANFSGSSFEYVWKNDEPTDIGSRKEGQPNHIGVCDTQTQINIRNSALSQFGSTKYAYAVRLPGEYGFPAFTNNTWKCNAFVAHRCTAIGATVPKINGPTVLGVLIPRGPPRANQWAGAQTTVHDGTFSTEILGWPLLPINTFPQPGFVIARSADTGHCGIIDYDGAWISAGSDNVNRKADLQNPNYQPAWFRQYTGN